MKKKTAKEKTLSEDVMYCSLDIETSDFDAENGEILELGMVFYTLEKKKISVIKEWQSVFKASKPVSPKILALTGISEEEIENGPEFRDKAEEIQALVNNCVIVGHNIAFDIGFLERFGIKFSGESIDTLDLAQMFLPTQSAYNLEALMHLLKVPHQDAHRALADAKAALVVFGKLMAHYSSFPSALKDKIVELFPEEKFASMHRLLSTDFKEAKVDLQKKFNIEKADNDLAKNIVKSSQIFTFPLGYDYHAAIYAALQSVKEKMLLVLPEKRIVYELWRRGLVYPVFNNHDLFNVSAFEKASKKISNPEQRYFLAKMLIWQETNWQTDTLMDVNFSFSGSQFRSQLSFEENKDLQWKLSNKEKVVACGYADFVNMDLEKEYSDRKVLILDLNSFEQALTNITTKKASWNDFTYTLKQISSTLGKKKGFEKVSDLVSQSDLFFALANMNAQKMSGGSSNLLVSDDLENDPSFVAILKAAENFIEKSREVNEKVKSQKLNELLDNVELFFKKQENTVRWMEFYENRFSFSISPLDLSLVAQNKLKHYPNISFTASLGSEQLIKYFTNRLNLKGYEIFSFGQQQLRKKFEVILPEINFQPEDLMPLLMKIEAPAALLMSGSSAVTTFYENNFRELQKKFKVSATGFSGGTNKILDNFGIHENSLLIGSDNFVLKQHHKKLRVKTLILTRLPFEQFSHPLFAAQAEKYANQFMDFNIPRALYNFHCLIKFFYSSDLEKIYILDSKIHKEYGKCFVDYLKSLPLVTLK